MARHEAVCENTVRDDAFLLRAPPLRRKMPVLASRGRGEEDDEGVARMLRLRVGGEFWAPVARHVRPVIVTASVAEQRRHGQAGVAALLGHVLRHIRRSEVMLVVRDPYGAAARMARLRGVAMTHGPVDPHALLDHAREVHALGLCDLVRLAALRGGIRALAYGPGDVTGRRVSHEECARDLTVRTCYRDPFDQGIVPLGRIVDILSLWRDRIRANREISVCVGMALWKRERIGDFLAHAPGRPVFLRHAKAALKMASRRHGAIAGWATRLPEGLVDGAADMGVPLWRVEDGFVRSVGLGSDLCVPCSIFVDRRGIYYDPSGPSDLEHILATAEFDAALKARARRLIRRLVDEGVSKYGQAEGGSSAPAWNAAGRRVILVPGQVADDLSVRAGGGEIQGNLELLRAVRDHNPDAFVVYRPHPDVDAGHRAGHLREEEVMRYADFISRGGAITSLMTQVDEIHTLTSLAGFEGLLRGCRVVTYGVPFYAGWGLTTDLGKLPCVRRNRSLSIEALVAGTLLLYPLYIDPVTRLPCEVETVLARFRERHIWRPRLLTRLRQLQGKLTQSVRKKKK
ncbi:capsular polysaccharide export protein, LipB/KpsS family [Novacetimonas pomaceti]|nr:beta-3-deoxy-D-manno-oct-2-ulosonic acid transferase [Novacetimonas pomaceti]